MYVERYLPFIGKESVPVRQRVHTEDILRFADAIGETASAYCDVEYGKKSAYGAIIAPPTFAVTMKCNRIEGIWVAPVGRIHASQEFNYYKPIVAEREYIVKSKFKDAFEKTGKNGVMVFTVEEKTVYDLDMQPCVSFLITIITRGSLFEEHDRRCAETTEQEALEAAEEKAFSGVRFEDLSEGMALETVVLPAIDRVTIAKYAGASGDFNAIHLDDEAARKVNFKSVVGHGLLSMALESTVLGKWFGQPDRYFVKNFKTKFMSPAYVGEIPTCDASVTSLDADSRTAVFTYSMKNSSGADIINGTLTVAFSE